MAFRPQTFANVEDPQELRRYLLELQQELARALGETNQLSPVVTSATYAANYDEIVRIDPPTGGTTVILPQPSIAKAGATVTLTVVGDGGQVTLECVGGQVNNASSFAFQAGVGDVVCRLDGPRGWFIPSAELSSSGPADAQYYVGAADGSLPNARLGTASSHITPDQGTANQVSWDFTDGNSSAYESWVWNDTAWSLQAASNPREVLRLNDVGTAIGYGDPVEVRERGTDVGDAYALDVVNGPGMTGHASVASRVGALQFCLAAHRIKTESATGIIDTSDWNDYDAIYFTGAQPEVQNIPQPTDPDGNAYEKVLWLLGSTVVAPLTIRHNTGTGTGRIFCPNLRDSEQFQLSSSQLVYNTVENRWFIVANTSVVAEANNDGTLLIGRSLNFMNAPAGLTWTLSKAAGEIRITPTLANIPLTALANQADDTWLGNISGSDAPPTANTLSGLAGTKLTYNSTSHAFDWDGMEGRIGGFDAGDFVGIDFTNGSGNVTFSLDTGAGGTFGVVANVDLSGVTYTAGDGLDLSGQEFSVDVSDFAGTGLEDDGTNNLRVRWEHSRTLSPGSGSGSIAILDTDENVRIDPTGTFTVTSITGGYPGQVVFCNMTTGGGDAVVWTNGTNMDPPNGDNVTQNAGDLVILFRSSSGETDWYIIPAYNYAGSVGNTELSDGSATGQIKQWNGSAWTDILLSTAVDSDAPGRLIAFTQYDEGESGTHAVNSATTRMLIERQGAGGGAGGVQGATGEARHASGGGAGGYELEWDTDPQTGSHAYSVGTRGTGGLGSTAASGGNGGATSYRGVANGGSGSAGVSTNTNPQSSVGAGGSAGLGLTGGSGSVGWAVNSTSGPAIGGDGGGSVLGQGGKGGVMIAGGAGGTSLSPSNNNDATGYGGGGGGGAVINSINDSSGGDGGPGVLRIWEFS